MGERRREEAIIDNKGEVCLEEEVEKRRRSGMSADEIAREMGVEPAWVGSLISMWEPENTAAAEREGAEA